MRAVVVIIAVLFATSARAQQRSVELALDNLRLEGQTMHAIVRLTNKSAAAYRTVAVECAFLAKSRAIDTGVAFAQNVGAGETVYAKVIGPIGPGAASIDEARCRITSAR
jgi:hypothetical protein